MKYYMYIYIVALHRIPYNMAHQTPSNNTHLSTQEYILLVALHHQIQTYFQGFAPKYYQITSFSFTTFQLDIFITSIRNTSKPTNGKKMSLI
jgi:hypothetical protein